MDWLANYSVYDLGEVNLDMLRRIAFRHPTSRYQVLVDAAKKELSKREEKLMFMPKKHKSAISYYTEDIKEFLDLAKKSGAKNFDAMPPVIAQKFDINEEQAKVCIKSWKASKAGKRSKRRGATYERHICVKLSEWWGSEIRRTPMSGGWQKTVISGDVAATEHDFPFSVECKNQEGWEFTELLTAKTPCFCEWWAQCKIDNSKLTIPKMPLLVFSKNNSPDYCILTARDWDSMKTAIPIRTLVMGAVTIMLFDAFLQAVDVNMFKEGDRDEC